MPQLLANFESTLTLEVDALMAAFRRPFSDTGCLSERTPGASYVGRSGGFNFRPSQACKLSLRLAQYEGDGGGPGRSGPRTQKGPGPGRRGLCGLAATSLASLRPLH